MNEPRLCRRCGMWTTATPGHHGPVCYWITNCARLLEMGRYPYCQVPLGNNMSRRSYGDTFSCFPARERVSLAAFAKRRERDQHRSWSLHIGRVLRFGESPHSSRTTPEFNRVKQLVSTLSEYGYSFNEIALYLFSEAQT